MKLFFQVFIASSFFISSPVYASEGVKIITNQPTTLVYPVFWHTPMGIHRGTQAHLATFTNNRTRFNQPQGMTCLRLLNDLNRPEDNDAFQLTVVGVNQGAANLIYNPTLSSLSIIKGTKKMPLITPLDVTASAHGALFISDPANKSVYVMKPIKNKFQFTSSLSHSDYDWEKPGGLASDQKGGCFVSDQITNQIIYFNHAYQPDYVIGPNLDQSIILNNPCALAVSTTDEVWSYNKENILFICDNNGKRLIKTDLKGKVLKTITINQPGISASGNTLASFAWIALDYYNQLWATSPKENKIYKFDSQLNLLAIFGQSGSGDYKFSQPTGITIFRHFGQVFIADKDSVHYFWIGTDIINAQAILNKKKQTVNLTFFLTEPALITIKIQNNNSQHNLYNKFKLPSGKQQLTWSPTTIINKKNYSIILQAEATYSSRSHFAKEVTVKLQ